jgi:hypothetical protein
MRDCTSPPPNLTGESSWGVVTGREKDRSRWVTQTGRAWPTGVRAEPETGPLRWNGAGGLIWMILWCKSWLGGVERIWGLCLLRALGGEDWVVYFLSGSALAFLDYSRLETLILIRLHFF